MRPCFRLLATALALPCLLISAVANEVGLESAGPTRFGARFSEDSGKRVATFNGDKGLMACFTFAADGNVAVSVQVKLAKGAKTGFKGRLAGKDLTGSVEGNGEAQWVALGAAKVTAAVLRRPNGRASCPGSTHNQRFCRISRGGRFAERL